MDVGAGWMQGVGWVGIGRRVDVGRGGCGDTVGERGLRTC